MSTAVEPEAEFEKHLSVLEELDLDTGSCNQTKIKQKSSPPWLVSEEFLMRLTIKSARCVQIPNA
jgi:hypothetical protein